MEALLAHLALGLAAGLLLLSLLCLLHLRDGLFGGISLLLLIMGISLIAHAASDIFMADPYREVVYAASGFSAALTVLMATFKIASFLRRSMPGEVLGT